VAQNCPDKASDLPKGCIDKTWTDDNIYDLLDKIVDNTNVHLQAEGSSTQTYITRNTGCLSKEEVDRIEDWLDALIALGRTPKRMYKQGEAGVLFPDPQNAADVAKWAACGGYWASVAAVRACLTLNGDQGIISEGTCVTHEHANNYYLILECLANYKCYPTCECPECVDEEYCPPCCQCWRIEVSTSTTNPSPPPTDLPHGGCKEATGTLVDGDCLCSLDGTTVDICEGGDGLKIGTLTFDLFRLTFDKIVVKAHYQDNETPHVIDEAYPVQEFDYDSTTCNSIGFILLTGENSAMGNFLITMGACTGEPCSCGTDCANCDPPLPSTFSVQISGDSESAFYGPLSNGGPLIGTHELSYDGQGLVWWDNDQCWWSKYIGYIELGGPEEVVHIYWMFVGDQSGGVLVQGFVDFYPSTTPPADPYSEVSFGTIDFFYGYNTATCTIPCAWLAVDNFSIACRTSGVDLCQSPNPGACNACAPAINEYLIVNFSGFTRPALSRLNGLDLMFEWDWSAIGSCEWYHPNYGFGGGGNCRLVYVDTVVEEVTIKRWELRVLVDFACTIVLAKNDTGGCTPEGNYTLLSATQIGSPPGNCDSGTANIRTSY